MITAEEAIEIYRKKYPKSDILKIKKVENFGFWLETSDIREDDCINLVTFDGKLERFPFSPVCPNPEFESAKKTENIFYKKRKKDKIWWIDHPDSVGRIEVSFDRKKILNLFYDYPQNFTPEQKVLFDKENPYWADFFGGKNEKNG